MIKCRHRCETVVKYTPLSDNDKIPEAISSNQETSILPRDSEKDIAVMLNNIRESNQNDSVNDIGTYTHY
jgi:hypothetical protein